MSNTSTTELKRLEDITMATITVAMLKQEPNEIVQKNASLNLLFKPAYDGLDYLDFASLNLPSGEEITLVRHHSSPQSGTEICVSYISSSTTQAIDRTCQLLNIAKTDLIWVDPSILN
jgi:hypothetical protein